MSIAGTFETPTDEKGIFGFEYIKYENFIAGVTAGVVSSFVLHPLDLLKIRFSVHEGTKDRWHPEYKGIANAIQTIVKQEGFRGLYKGVVPNCWGSGSSWGLYFLFYNAIKASMTNGDTSKPLDASKHLIAGAEAGCMTLCITNPIWVVKTRLCLQYSQDITNARLHSPSISSQSLNINYKGMLDTFVKIYRHEGIPGLYKGFVPGLLGVSHGAIQFMVYEEFKKYSAKYNETSIDAKLGSFEAFLFGAFSKLIASSLTYPYQVVRTRLQDQHVQHNGAIDIIKKIVKNETLLGFYKGLLPNLIRVVPASAITFLVYENMHSFLFRKKDHKA